MAKRLIDEEACRILFAGGHRVFQVEHDRIGLVDERRAQGTGVVARDKEHAATQFGCWFHDSLSQSSSWVPAPRNTAASTRARITQSRAPLSSMTIEPPL